MRHTKKLNRYEQHAANVRKLAEKLNGTGVYIFRNNTKGTLSLPKAAMEGLKWPIPVGGTFKGDSYFMQFVKTHELSLVEVVTNGGPLPSEPERNPVMSEEKLILDQPDQVTVDGQIEHVVKKAQPIQPPKPLNEVLPSQPGTLTSPTLINEEPLDGVEIILG